jgi:hypothetical protein
MEIFPQDGQKRALVQFDGARLPLIHSLVGRGSRTTQRFKGECRAELTHDFARSRRLPSRGSARDHVIPGVLCEDEPRVMAHAGTNRLGGAGFRTKRLAVGNITASRRI